jgi:hypothetical protein
MKPAPDDSPTSGGSGRRPHQPGRHRGPGPRADRVGPHPVPRAAARRRHGERRDPSIMPAIPGGNTNAPAMMIGEHCASLMLRA